MTFHVERPFNSTRPWRPDQFRAAMPHPPTNASPDPRLSNRHPTPFHLEHPLRPPKQIRPRLQRSHHQLTVEPTNLVNELHQMRPIKLSRRIIQEKSWSSRSPRLQKLNLSKRHRDSHQLLLPPRKNLPRRPPTKPNEHIRPMRPAMRQPPGLISTSGVHQRLSERHIL